MVSYFNPLGTSMFPNPPAAQLAGSGVRHHPHQPSSAAMAAAAGHQFHSNYHAAYAAAAYGHHQYNPYNIAADLNSNMYSGQQSSGNTGTQFGTSAAAAAVAGSDNWTTNQWPYHQHPPASTVPATVPPTTASNSRFDGWPATSSDESPPTPGGETGGRRSPGNYGTTQSHSSGGSPSGTPTPNAQFQHFTTNFNGNSSANDANLDADSPLNQMPLASPVSLASPNARPQPARSPYEWMKKPSYQSQPEKSDEQGAILCRTRTKDKYRVVYSDHQRLELEKEFHYSRYITIRRKAELANSVGLSERQVKIWFQNRRAKERRALKKHEEAIVKEKMDPASAAAAAAAACAAAANFGHVPFSDSFHPATTSIAVAASAAAVNGGGLDFGSPPPPPSVPPSQAPPPPSVSSAFAMKFE